MSPRRIGQEGIWDSAPGSDGPYQLRNENYGDSRGNVVDNSEGEIPVQVSVQRMVNLQNPSQRLRYPEGKSASQEY